MTLLLRILGRSILVTVFSVAVALLVTELVLHLVFRDRGRLTLGGPGGQDFEHLAIQGDQRGRLDLGPRRPGVPRLLVIGDSITYGQGVRDWRATWPEVLAVLFEDAGHPVEMAVLAQPGRDMPEHVETLAQWGSRVNPDVLIYQWYVNDIEVVRHRPEERPSWHGWPLHEPLRKWSFLYYTFDRLAAGRVQAAPYRRYIVEDFRPGTFEWSEFERSFHAFTTRAQAAAPQRLMVLYPQVPYRDEYPLQTIHERMRAMAAPHTLRIPPAAWIRRGGARQHDPSAPWQDVLALPAGLDGTVVETHEYLLRPGPHTWTITYQPSGDDDGGTLGSLEIVDAASNGSIGRVALAPAAANAGYRPASLTVAVEGSSARLVRGRIRSAGGGAWQIAEIGLQVDYGWQVLDLTERLNAFNTHASLFDAHPNEVAHRVIAEEIYRALQARSAAIAPAPAPPRN